MGAAGSQLATNQLLQAFRQDELYLFLGSAFVTVGLLSAAFSMLRRRLDPLLLWLALFSVLYGARLWIQTGLLFVMQPDSEFSTKLAIAINYVVPIPATFFFEAAGFLGRWGKSAAVSLTCVFAGLFLGTLVAGPLVIFAQINHFLVIASFLALIARVWIRRETSRDLRVTRAGLLVFGAFVLRDNIVQAFWHPSRTEPLGFMVFLGCLGYVAARQTLHRDSQLAEIQKELDVARRIQLSILPAAFPPSSSFRVAAKYLPMTSVAGDFYDFLLGDDYKAGLLIADVSGHGVPAALIASMVKMAATSQKENTADPARLLAGMNIALCGNTQQQFITAAYLHLDSAAGELRYSAAGHPPMLLMRNGSVVRVEENGLILAAFTFSNYTNAVRRLEPGDRLLLYTDGILEAANEQGEEFGSSRLETLLCSCAGVPTAEAADHIVSSVQRWQVSQEDDLTVLVCDYYAGLEP